MKLNRELEDFEIKEIQLKILDEFIEFCEKNNLKYFLAYGSLLGAIRHKGYIPWDDDIDVWMVREEYDKLLKIYENIGPYKLLESSIDSNYKYPFAKLSDSSTKLIEETEIVHKELGINIDIFPLDKITIKNKKKVLNWMKILRKIYTIKILKENTKRNIFKIIILKILKKILLGYDIDNILKKVYKLSKIDIESDNNYEYSYLFHPGCYFKKEWFLSNEIVEFEERKVIAPKNYKKVLTEIFNDYNKLPPIEKRKAHHSFIAYLK